MAREPEAGAGAETARRARPLVADLAAPRPAIYWADLVASAGLAWGLLLAAASRGGLLAAPLFLCGSLALYRAASFIHELTHLRPGAVPGFGAAWNALVGVPLLLPSFLYAGVHGVHHAPGRYGTSGDPEYLPLARWPRRRLLLFLASALFLPAALAVRFLLLAPLSLLSRRLRALLWARASSLAINPAWRRAPPHRTLARAAARQEIACAAWAWAILALVASGRVPAHQVLTVMAAAGLVGLLNQVRTLAAHRFRGAGDPMRPEEQLRDSVDLVGPALPAALLAPVGLRFHALHHLLPGLPYHALGEARRRLAGTLPAEVGERSLLGAVRALGGEAHVPRATDAGTASAPALAGLRHPSPARPAARPLPPPGRA